MGFEPTIRVTNGLSHEIGRHPHALSRSDFSRLIRLHLRPRKNVGDLGLCLSSGGSELLGRTGKGAVRPQRETGVALTYIREREWYCTQCDNVQEETKEVTEPTDRQRIFSSCFYKANLSKFLEDRMSKRQSESERF